MSEEPIFCVSAKEVHAEETWHFAVARRLLESEQRGELLERLTCLHPQTLADLSQSTRELANEQHMTNASQLAAMSPALEMTKEEALLLLLKVQMNAFESGVYIELAMVNHACYPNCLKLGPGRRVSAAGTLSWCPRSEILAVRNIQAGEEVTISFLCPLERTARSRATLFRAQHLVDLVPSHMPAEELEAMNPEGGDAEGDVDRRVLDGLEGELDMFEAGQHGDQERLLRLEREAIQVLHPRHLVLCRLRRQLAEVARSGLATSPTVEDAELLVRVAWEVRQTQALLLPPTHLDHAETAENLAVGLAALLALDRERLYSAFDGRWGDFGTTSKSEAALRQEAAALRRLYETSGALGEQTNCLSGCAKQPESASSPLTVAAGEDWSIFD